MDYAFLQQYWWFLVSLLGALLVFLLFVQGGQTFIFAARRDEPLQRMIVNSTGRKWEFTLTTLVRRCLLCLLPALLLNQLRWSLLGMDLDLLDLCHPGGLV